MIRYAATRKKRKKAGYFDTSASVVRETAVVAPEAEIRPHKSAPPAVSTLKGAKLIPFGWYGGKFSHLDWLLPLLPKCHHYCEPYAGSAAILLNRPPSPVETCNDLDNEVVNFFRVLRDKKDDLVEAIGLTPFSREEFALACKLDPALSPMERARRFYVRSNRAGVRLLMACMLAKAHQPFVDPRKPYTKIGSKDCFSGRTYDEQFIGDFITRHGLPCNSTTAFLTPTLRNMDATLTTKVVLVGRPAAMYQNALQILDDVHAGRVSARDVLDESVRLLVIDRNERKARLKTLLSGVGRVADALPLSSEDTVNLIAQHLRCKGASRLPVLIVAAAYEAAKEKLGERVLNLTSHNAVDEQTGALGDVEITILGDDKVVTSYEMKNKAVARGDIDRALQKIASSSRTVQNYLFITTEAVDEKVREYAASKHDETGGVEIAILDCIGFLRHFLHLFHRLRKDFLDHYQTHVLREADSAVSQALKEAFLALRQAAESAE